jgi:hypothetical protein
MLTMSEFKFNCPVCGQHIATDSHASGAQIECPTCFQAIIVPQAPMAQTKYILSATQYIKPQPAPQLTPAPVPVVAKRSVVAPVFFLALFFVCVFGVTAYVVHSRSSRAHSTPTSGDSTNSTADAAPDKNWRLQLAGVSIPEAPAAGRVRNREFICEHVYLQNGTLALRQGPVHRPEMAVNVHLTAREAQELAGKRFNVETNNSGGMPGIVVRWGEGPLRAAEPFTNGYAMKLEFGSIEGDRVPGRIFLCLPDASKSYVAGTFTAEIRKPALSRQP